MKTWLPKFVTAVMEGRYPEPEAVAPSSISAANLAEFLKDYRKRHCEAEKLNLHSLDSKLNVIESRFGTLPLVALEKPGPIDDFKSDLIAARKTPAALNRYLPQLKHMINWAIGREPPPVNTSRPFEKPGRRS